MDGEIFLIFAVLFVVLAWPVAERIWARRRKPRSIVAPTPADDRTWAHMNIACQGEPEMLSMLDNTQRRNM